MHHVRYMLKLERYTFTLNEIPNLVFTDPNILQVEELSSKVQGQTRDNVNDDLSKQLELYAAKIEQGCGVLRQLLGRLGFDLTQLEGINLALITLTMMKELEEWLWEHEQANNPSIINTLCLHHVFAVEPTFEDVVQLYKELCDIIQHTITTSRDVK